MRLEWDGWWTSDARRDSARGHGRQEDPARGDARSVFSARSTLGTHTESRDQHAAVADIRIGGAGRRPLVDEPQDGALY